MSHFVFFISQLLLQPQNWFLYGQIAETLLLVLNTWTLSEILAKQLGVSVTRSLKFFTRNIINIWLLCYVKFELKRNLWEKKMINKSTVWGNQCFRSLPRFLCSLPISKSLIIIYLKLLIMVLVGLYKISRNWCSKLFSAVF